MLLFDEVARVVAYTVTLDGDARLRMVICYRLAEALLLISWCWIPELKIAACDSSTVARDIEVRICDHLSKSRDLYSTARSKPATIIHGPNASASSVFSSAFWRQCFMVAFLPYPHVLAVVSTAAALIDWQLEPRAKPRAVLPAASLGLGPRCFVQAAAHTHVRTTADAVCRIKRPPQLRATEQRGLLERRRRWRRRR